MFTGIVRETGGIRSVRRRPGVVVLDIDAPRVGPGLAVGDSVAVNGVCLTVTAGSDAGFRVDLSPETRRTSTAGTWRTGDRVHLEPALTASDPIGGHFVLGHVDDVGRVLRISAAGGTRQVTIAAPPPVLARLLPKGSVAVDGVSLTLDAGPFHRSFTVTLIPQTLRETRFGALRPGDAVNLEVDVLAKAAFAQALDARPPAGGRITTVDDILARGWRR